MLRRAVSMDGEDHDRYDIESTMTPRQKELLKSGRSAATNAGSRGRFRLAATKAMQRTGTEPVTLSLNAYGRLGMPVAVGTTPAMARSVDSEVPRMSPGTGGDDSESAATNADSRARFKLAATKVMRHNKVMKLSLNACGRLQPAMCCSLDSKLVPQPPGTSGDDSDASRPFDPLGLATPAERAIDSPRARKLKLKMIKKNSTPMAKSLDDKLLDYEHNRKELDRLSAATGVRRDSLTDVAEIVVGERCEVFCPKADTWVRGDVVVVHGTRVQVRYLSPATDTTGDGKPQTEAQTETRWVDQTSSEFRRGVSESLSPRPGAPDLASYSREHSACFRRLSLNEKKRGFQSLASPFHERTATSMMQLVAWTYSSDLFTGLNERQRREICLQAELEEADEHECLVSVGEIGVRILAVLEGTCAIYTMRGIKSKETGFNEEVDEVDKGEEDSKVDLREKFQNMQRRASVAVRTDSVAAPVVINENGEAVPTPAVSACERRRSIAIAMVQAQPEKVAHQARAQRASAFRPTVPASQDGIPIRIEFREGDALSLNSTFFNVYEDQVEEHGWKRAIHTITAESNVRCMAIKRPHHVKLLHGAYQASMREKVQLLKSVPNYNTHPDECLKEMAKYARRTWYSPGDQIMREGDEAKHVFYIVSGQCRVVKDLHKLGERVLTVLGRGACMGDWGVVNKQRRTASCVAIGEVQLLVMDAFNFEATATQALLDALSATAQKRTDESKAEARTAGSVRASAMSATTIAENDEIEEEVEEQEKLQPTFQLVTRRQKKAAAARLIADIG